MTARAYRTPAGFKQALEERLRAGSRTGGDFARRRQLLVFDRFLARVGAELGDAVVLKGGLVLELRLDRARTTKDVDLRLAGASDDLLSRLQEAARKDLGDFLAFEIRPDTHHPEIQNEGMVYEGLRFRAECKLAGKIYGQAFGVDVAFGDPILGEPELATADDVLEFVGVPPPTVRLLPLETHIAEKLHALTLPRARLSSRVKDLPDLALLATVRSIQTSRLHAAFRQTFELRKTHALPMVVPAAPAEWADQYAAIAREDQLRWTSLEAVAGAVSAFLDPVLGTKDEASWDPAEWKWRTQ